MRALGSRTSSSPRSPTSCAPRSPRSSGYVLLLRSARTCPRTCVKPARRRRSATPTGSSGWSPTCCRPPQVDEGPLHVVRTRTDLAQIVRDAVVAATPTAEAARHRARGGRPRAPGRCSSTRSGWRRSSTTCSRTRSSTAPAAARSASGSAVDGNRVELAVSDTGIGIEAADRDRALHPLLPRPARRGAVDPGRRARAEHHQGDRREPRRPDRGRQRDRPGQHLPGPAPARRRAAACRLSVRGVSGSRGRCRRSPGCG